MTRDEQRERSGLKFGPGATIRTGFTCRLRGMNMTAGAASGISPVRCPINVGKGTRPFTCRQRNLDLTC